MDRGLTNDRAMALRNRLLLGTAFATSAFLGGYRGYIRRAYAQCAGAAGTYNCGGSLNTTQTLNGAPLTVTTVPGFSIDTTVNGGDAFTLTGAGGLTFTDNNSSTITGADYGIRAINNASGALSITTTGTVTGASDNGIFARNDFGTDLTINAANVSGGTSGIYARNGGTGALTITATGTVTGNGGAGIDARAYGGTTDLTISAAAVSGGTHGIIARQYGTGALTITTTGTITGGSVGIAAQHHGSGALAVVANGDVGAAINGINATNYNGSGLTVTTGVGTTVTGGVSGIVASSFGSGTLNITVNGDVTGTVNDGIYARHFGGGPIVISVGAASIVTSNGAAANDFAIETPGGPADVTAAGTLNGGGGALQFDQANPFADRLELHPTAIVNGTVFAGPGTDTLAFAGTGNGSFNLGDIDTGANTQQYRAFENFTVDSGIWSFSGATTVALNVSGGIAKGTGTFGGLTLNAGGILAPGNSIGTLTINGNFVGNGGLLEIEAILGGDASPTDLLVVTGDTSGSTDVRVINLGGAGAQTVQGIKIVDVGGTSGGTFTLLGDFVFQGQQAVVGGAYAYMLHKNGISTPADGDWYLRSAIVDGGPGPGPLYAPSVPLYEAYAGVLQTFNELGTLQQRVGNRSWGGGATPQGADVPGLGPIEGNGIWGRIDAAHGEFDPQTSTSSTDYDVTTWKLQAGLDALLHETGAGLLIGGLTVHYGTASSDVSSIFGEGSIDATGYGFGGTLTWYGNGGFYVDGQAQATWYDSDLTSDTLGTELADGNSGFGYGLSIETGQKIALHSNWSLTPQAQLAYSAVEFDDFTDPFGAAVSLDSSDSLVGRLGLSADYESILQDASGQVSRSHIYGIANLYYDFLDGSDVDVAGVAITSETQALWGGLGLGGSVNFADDRYSVYAEALARTSLEDFGDSNIVSGKLGFRVKW